jgi:2-aminoadipate transaminase
MTRATNLDPYDDRYAARVSGLRSSAMRDLMSVIGRPEVISLAGGLPYTQAFPPDVLTELAADVAADATAQALQYGPTEGLAEAREAICGLLAGQGVPAVPEHVLVTTGGQQVLDLVCRTSSIPATWSSPRARPTPGCCRRWGHTRQTCATCRWTPRAC